MTQEKGKTKTNKKIFFLVLILVSFLAALISMEYGQTVTNGKYASNIKAIKDFSYDAGNKADFTVWKEHIYYCTKDGVQYIDSNGEILWSETYNMTLPYMVQNEGIIGISEQKGRVLIVYDSDGKKYSVQTNSPIISFSLNSSGYSSVITSSDSEYQLEVYNLIGDVIFSGHFQMAHGIPVSSSISNSGNILAIGFLNISEMTVSSRVSFYDIKTENTKGSETNSSVFASFDEADAACGIVHFLDNNSVAIISDKSLTFVYANPDTAEKYSEKNKIEFKNQIKQVAFGQNADVYVSFGEKLINSGEDPLENGTTICYDKAGNQKFSVISEKKVTGIYPAEDSVLIGTDRNFKNYNLSGDFIWEYNTGQDTKKLLLINDDDLVLFVGPNKASIFRLTDEILQNQQMYDPDEENKEEETEIIIPTITQTETETEETTSQPETQSIKQENTNNQKKNTQNSAPEVNNTQKPDAPSDTNKKDDDVSEASPNDDFVEIDPSELESDNSADNTDNANVPDTSDNRDTVNEDAGNAPDNADTPEVQPAVSPTPEQAPSPEQDPVS